MVKINKYIIITALMLMAFPLLFSSCRDDDFPEYGEEAEDPSFVVEGNAIKFSLTLDAMGGSDDGYYNPNKDLESYIDPDKVRVLFFTENDKFLFESKSRWIKKSSQAEATGFYKWEVLVPFFTHGNDQVNEYDWPWEDIREYMTTKPFKIAILANRPEKEWNMGILKKGPSDWMQNKSLGSKPANWDKPVKSDTLVPYGWFGNHGPYWTKANSYNKNIAPEDIRDVFDLHHCQYDPIYDGKNWYNGSAAGYVQNGKGDEDYIGFYDHIAEMHGTEPWMGATSSWVEWGTNDNIRTGWDGKPAEIGSDNYNSNWSGVRNAAQLTKEHPIPMYGIQLYAPLTSWEEGTTFNLGRLTSDYEYSGDNQICMDRNEEGWADKSVSLLRSVVKLELVVPDNIDPEYVAICYTNIYARCEPADTWTPTELIWNDKHETDAGGINCEWKYIQNYGPIAYANAPINRDVYAYQKRISWLWGVWKEKGWQFNSTNTDKPGGIKDFTLNDLVNESATNRASGLANGVTPPPAPSGDLKYPRIFNTCIQRNNNVHVPKHLRYHDIVNKTYHYIVYMGERNVNDPTDLSKMGDDGNGKATIIYWQVATPLNNNTYNVYSFNLNDNPRVNSTTYAYATNGGQKFPLAPDGSLVGTNGGYNIEGDIMNGNGTPNWPLVRNHVYRIWLNGTGPTRSGSAPMLNARGAVTRSKTIDFNRQLFRGNAPDPNSPASSLGDEFVRK